MTTISLLEHVDTILSAKASWLKRLLALLWLLLFILSGAWTSPITHNPGDPVSSADWNTYVRDNLNYLLSGRQIATLNYNHAANYTTTSQSFGDVDAANVILTLTPQSTRVLVEFIFTAGVTTTGVQFDIYNTTLAARGGDATNGLTGTASGVGGGPFQWRVAWLFTGLTPGVSTGFKLQWRCSGASSTATLYASAVMITGIAREV